MNWLRNKLHSFWLLVKNRLWGTPIPYKTIRVPELPDELQRENIYLVGENDFLWSAALVCPCGCQAVVQLNLLPDAKPRWLVEEHDDNTISLAPSIWSRKGCNSHYFVRRGFVKWHFDN